MTLEKFKTVDTNGETVYLLEDIKKHLSWKEFDGNLFVYDMENEIWMSFAFLEYSGAEVDDGSEMNPAGRLFWYGEGPLGNLKELRHSYFPEYVFYANPTFIKKCCDILLTYFEE